MSGTSVTVLTPPGAGAIATMEVSGPRAWAIARQLFRPAVKPLPEKPELHRFWFGTLGEGEGAGNEVILAVTGESTVEIHCHGGRRVVQWVVEQFTARGCVLLALPRLCGGEGWGEGAWDRDFPLTLDPSPPQSRGRGKEIVYLVSNAGLLLQRAPTLRTASILLDQLHGAFERAVTHTLKLLDTDPVAAREPLRELARYAPVGRHLVEPRKVVVAGAPNVGKSSLVNALAGFQRAVVSEVAGTTRDLVSVQLAFDGWPVELTDTAGLREAEGLEAEGVERANRALSEADLVLWVFDVTDPNPRWPSESEVAEKGCWFVANKCDLPAQWHNEDRNSLRISVKTGAGIAELTAAIVAGLVPDPPPPGVSVPYTPVLANLIEVANVLLPAGGIYEASRFLRACLPSE